MSNFWHLPSPPSLVINQDVKHWFKAAAFCSFASHNQWHQPLLRISQPRLTHYVITDRMNELDTEAKVLPAAAQVGGVKQKVRGYGMCVGAGVWRTPSRPRSQAGDWKLQNLLVVSHLHRSHWKFHLSVSQMIVTFFKNKSIVTIIRSRNTFIDK